ncbi:hypothetical protein yfred0001_3520 [Yersinia frederiksenii ATCC 33641]|nr:hypothetical protein yfred0001_3520 [Yersinia frederiksenii ATCC 33641]
MLAAVAQYFAIWDSSEQLLMLYAITIYPYGRYKGNLTRVTQ